MQPLADKIRPTTLAEFIGQEELTGTDKPLYNAVNEEHILSFILWGPPGSGKTTLAKIYAAQLNQPIFELSAVNARKSDVRDIIDQPTQSETKILFLDEIHRFNKAQQDFLLPFVEQGDLTLIGATTENPSFEIISALLSRCQVFKLEQHSDREIHQILDRVEQETEIDLNKQSRELLVELANGDAREAISMIENTYKLYEEVSIENIKETVQSKQIRYDREGEQHHHAISAFIKSMRAGKPSAALYYLARMIEGGEDPKYIARRMVIFASEDIGNAQPTALVVANEVFKAVEVVGLPECEINLAHGASYLSKCKKDRSSYDAYRKAQEDVKNHENLEIPYMLRNRKTELNKEMGYGEGYEKYSDKDFLPDRLKGKNYFG
ncbi:MAG: AAA family ATPase [Parcubacteria group bacterium QH_9_35_7]|nr:MAG: AAA family ATPase [Parcubacteria group bacterium QH_9_35_7]